MWSAPPSARRPAALPPVVPPTDSAMFDSNVDPRTVQVDASMKAAPPQAVRSNALALFARALFRRKVEFSMRKFAEVRYAAPPYAEPRPVSTALSSKVLPRIEVESQLEAIAPPTSRDAELPRNAQLSIAAVDCGSPTRCSAIPPPRPERQRSNVQPSSVTVPYGARTAMPPPSLKIAGPVVAQSVNEDRRTVQFPTGPRSIAPPVE